MLMDGPTLWFGLDGFPVTRTEEIVTNIETGGEPEPPDVFAPTLLRLRLLLPT